MYNCVYVLEIGKSKYCTVQMQNVPCLMSYEYTYLSFTGFIFTDMRKGILGQLECDISKPNLQYFNHFFYIFSAVATEFQFLSPKM